MSKADILSFLEKKRNEPLPDVTGKSDTELRIMAQERYPIENPKCQSERAAKLRMREEYFQKLKTLRDEN